MEPQSTLEWFLDFINLEIEDLGHGVRLKLGHGDRLKWITETLYVIDCGKPKREFRALPRYKKRVSEKKINEWVNSGNLEECQSYIKNFLNELMGNIERYIAEGSKLKPLNKLERKSTHYKYEIKSKGTLRIQLPITSGTVRKTINKGTNDEKTLYTITSEEMDKSKFRVIFDLQNDQESLLVALCQNLERIPVGSLRKCPAPKCGNWFLHLSKKKKIYCTNKCAARHGSKNRRDMLKTENSKEYEHLLRGNAERARTSYEKKQREKNPNAIIARRPTKYKE